jgi:hypothetical protein
VVCSQGKQVTQLKKTYERVSGLIKLKISAFKSFGEIVLLDDQKIKLPIPEKEMVELTNTLKSLITDYKIQLNFRINNNQKFDKLMAWHYVFKTYDILVNNEFITQENYRSMIQEKTIMDEIIFFTTKFLEVENRKLSITSSDNLYILTENYIWTYLGYFSGNSLFLHPFWI